jgi:hypothetical protein
MRFSNTRRVTTIITAAASLLIAASSWASIVWDLNPDPRQNAPVGSTSRTYTSGGYTITAYGFDNNAGIGTPHELFYKNEDVIGGATEFGLGLTNTAHNELQANLNFIQFDFTAMLAAGLLNGQISVGSVQPGEAFAIYGSNALGVLGTQVGPTYDSSVDNMYVAITNFGQFNFYSILATADDVLPVSIQADLPAVPEMGALAEIFALLVLMFAAEIWRRRRQASL